MKYLNDLSANFKYQELFEHMDNICDMIHTCYYNKQTDKPETQINRDLQTKLNNEIHPKLLSIIERLTFYDYNNGTLTKNDLRTVFLISWIESSFFQNLNCNSRNVIIKTPDVQPYKSEIYNWDEVNSNANEIFNSETVKSFQSFNEIIINNKIKIDEMFMDIFKNLSFSSFLNYRCFLNRFNLSNKKLKLSLNETNDYYLNKMLKNNNNTVFKFFISLMAKYNKVFLNDEDLFKQFMLIIPVEKLKTIGGYWTDIINIFKTHNLFKDSDFMEGFLYLNLNDLPVDFIHTFYVQLNNVKYLQYIVNQKVFFEINQKVQQDFVKTLKKSLKSL